MANLLGYGLTACGIRIVDLSEEEILQGARSQTGLEDLGNERFRVPLKALLDSYNDDTNLTTVGRWLARRMLIHIVANRLLIHRDLKCYPEILSGRIDRPLFVVGLPRTGTTLLYNLLAQDSASRPLLFWESVSPAPPPDPETRDCDPRIETAEKIVAGLNGTLPNLAAIHEMNPRGPDECLGLLFNTFVTPFFRGNLPRYREWLYSIPDHETRAAYQEYRQQLLLLQWRCSGNHWVLKCPSHLFGLGELLAVFPDACVVHTHRDPVKAVPSLCSLSAALDGVSYKTVDMEEVGQRTVGIIEQLVNRSMQAREEVDGGQVYDMHYKEFVKDPVAAVRGIYEHFGYNYSPAMEENVRAYLGSNPRHRHGVHRYSLDSYGLDEETLRDRFSGYCDRFVIEPE
jgi:hypothetical protein